MIIKLKRTARLLPAVVWMALIFWLSATPAATLLREVGPVIEQAPKTTPVRVGRNRLPINWYKVGHFVGYAGLGAALLYGLGTRKVYLALGWAGLYAVTDEFHQMFVAGRHARVEDVLLDTAAAGAAIVLVLVGRWAWQRLKRGRRERAFPR